MHIQFHTEFQLVQQCIQISTRINILQCTYVHLRLFYIACIQQGFVDPKCNKQHTQSILKIHCRDELLSTLPFSLLFCKELICWIRLIFIHVKKKCTDVTQEKARVFTASFDMIFSLSFLSDELKVNNICILWCCVSLFCNLATCCLWVISSWHK